MGRIHFIFLSSLFLLVTLVLIAATSYNPQIFRYKASAQNSNLASYDVIVAGGGSSGVAAAIQAARLGATVAIIEETDWLGGQITSANVSTMDESPVEDQFGIYKEFVTEAKRLYGTRPVSTCYGGGPEANCFEPHIAKKAIENLIANTRNKSGATIDIYYRTKVASVIKSGTKVTGVVLSTGSTKNSKVLIDATEFGDVIPKTGVKYRLGNKIYQNGGVVDTSSTLANAPACIQDITYTAVIRKYGPPTQAALTSKPVIPKPPDYGLNGEPQREFARQVSLTPVTPFPWSVEKHNSYRGLPDVLNPTGYRPPNNPLDYASITKTSLNFANDYSMYATYNPLNQARVPGLSDVYVEPQNNKTIGLNFVENMGDRQTIICEAKKKTWAFLYYMQNDLGYSDWSLATEEKYCENDSCYVLAEANCPSIPDSVEKYMPSYVYTRESRRIIGATTLTAKDLKDEYRKTNRYASAIAVGSYPTDLHNCMWDQYLETKLENINDLSDSGEFQVPLESLIPQEIDGFIAAEKNISQTRLVNGATRLQPITMNTGQAGGVTAAIASKHQIKLAEISPRLIQAQLAVSGNRLSAINILDVAIGSAFRQAAEFVFAAKLLVGDGKGNLSFNREVTRAEAGAVLLRVKNIQATSTTQRFTDVPASHTFFKVINTMFEKGLTAGCSSQGPQYCPERIITRSELAFFISRLDPDTSPMTLVPANAYTFTDVTGTDDVKRRINTVVAEGIMSACSSDGKTFCPNKNLTRGEFADSLLKYFIYRSNKKPLGV